MGPGVRTTMASKSMRAQKHLKEQVTIEERKDTRLTKVGRHMSRRGAEVIVLGTAMEEGES